MFQHYVPFNRAAKAFSLAALVFAALAAPRVATAGSVDSYCNPDEVMVFNYSPRIHVRCTVPVGSIRYFAVSTSDQAQAARTLSTLNTALVAGRTLLIRYDPADLSGAGIGCNNSDCRLIQAVAIEK